MRVGFGFCTGALAGLFLFLLPSSSSAHGVIIGHDGAGRVGVRVDVDLPVALDEVFGLINGWGGTHPGLSGADDDHGDLLRLPDDANIAVEIVALDPAFKLWLPGFVGVLDEVGDQWVLGGPGFSEHPTWHIDSDDPAYDANQTQWHIALRAHDLGASGLGSSQPFELTFVPVPEPSTAGLLIVGWLAAPRRVTRASPGRLAQAATRAASGGGPSPGRQGGGRSRRSTA